MSGQKRPSPPIGKKKGEDTPDIRITFDSCYRGKIEIHTDTHTGKVLYFTIIR